MKYEDHEGTMSCFKPLSEEEEKKMVFGDIEAKEVS